MLIEDLDKFTKIEMRDVVLDLAYTSDEALRLALLADFEKKFALIGICDVLRLVFKLDYFSWDLIIKNGMITKNEYKYFGDWIAHATEFKTWDDCCEAYKNCSILDAPPGIDAEEELNKHLQRIGRYA